MYGHLYGDSRDVAEAILRENNNTKIDTDDFYYDSGDSILERNPTTNIYQF